MITTHLESTWDIEDETRRLALMMVSNKMLGIEIFTEDGKQDREIETRCQKSNNVTFLIGPAVKTIIGTTFTPTQTWTIIKKTGRKISTCEMKPIRRDKTNQK